MSLVNFDQVQDDRYYAVALRPGLNDLRWGLRWRDGVAAPVPGSVVRELRGSDNFHVFEHPAEISWQSGSPVEGVSSPLPGSPAPPPPAPTPEPEPVDPLATDASEMSVRELRKHFKEAGVSGMGSASRAELLAAWTEHYG